VHLLLAGSTQGKKKGREQEIPFVPMLDNDDDDDIRKKGLRPRRQKEPASDSAPPAPAPAIVPHDIERKPGS
jgi:hypothetical protein